MFDAIRRLITIIAGTLFLTFLAVVFMRWAGSQQVFSPPPHPWFAVTDWTVVQPQNICANSQPSVPNEQTLVWLPVRFVEGSWRVKCDKKVPLKIELESASHPNWLLSVDAHDTAHLDELIQDIGPFEKNKTFGVHATSQTVARYLRKKAPQWVYGADAATLLRLHMFAGFWMETAFDFWPDFVVQVPGDANTRLSARERAELDRRKKRVIKVEFTD